MKKITLIAICIALVFVLFTLFAGCNKETEQTQTTVSITTITEEDEHLLSNEYLLSLAEKSNSYVDILDILIKNSSEDFQLQLCKCNNKIVQESLLNYEDLSSQALIYICENPNVRNINNSVIEGLFIMTICKADLTSEEQLQIAKTNRYVTQRGILERDYLAAEALIYILQFNNKINWTVNINQFQIKQRIKDQVIKVPLTIDKKKQLEELNIPIVDDALMERERQEFQSQNQ